MTAVTHTMVTIVGITALQLQGGDMALAFLFGVAIDLDHVIKIPLFRKLTKWWKFKHLNWRTPLQEPISLLWIIPLSIWLSTWVPIIFFLLHLALDYITGYSKKPFFPFSNYSTRGLFANWSDTWKEIGIFVISALITLWLIFSF
ncbi:hypothetical protein IID20_04225 [Patescibacteria group bacterium]|nr:hypothetical protein [Patescibacteria group bacterium]